ncbi:hypothetical protein [Neisseria bergeri]|uniref:hypothetical protein n=1 Tax=Neisseria bergeri TaxID=1906581 RepID=UPI0027E1D89A|nr:hypothetical protein [Neisseria bergeri]
MPSETPPRFRRHDLSDRTTSETQTPHLFGLVSAGNAAIYIFVKPQRFFVAASKTKYVGYIVD